MSWGKQIDFEVRVAQGENFEDPEADQAQLKFEDFYYEVFMELSGYGEVEDMVVADNLGEHMMGNVYSAAYKQYKYYKNIIRY